MTEVDSSGVDSVTSINSGSVGSAKVVDYSSGLITALPSCSEAATGVRQGAGTGVWQGADTGISMDTRLVHGTGTGLDSDIGINMGMTSTLIPTQTWTWEQTGNTAH